MKKEDKKIKRILHKKISLSQWESFPLEIKNNPLILKECVTLLREEISKEKKRIIQNNPIILAYMSESEQYLYANKMNFCYLSKEIQLKMINKNNEYIVYASAEVKHLSLRNNSKLLSFLSEKEQFNYVEGNRYLLEDASESVQIKKANESTKFIALCSKKIQLLFVKNNPNNYKHCSNEVKDLISLNLLDYNFIKMDTLNSYVVKKEDTLNPTELIELKNRIQVSNRKDKEEFCKYIDYLIANYRRNETVKLVIS